MTASFRTTDLSVGYTARRSRIVVLQKLNLSIRPGDLVCLLGPNGVGKSTLLRTLAGIQPALAGSIEIDGVDLRRMRPLELARRIGSPNAPRAVGLANGHNPIGIIVPCHRIIGANGSLTGYGGGIERKRWLLAHEARWSYGLTPVVTTVRASSRGSARSDCARASVHTRRGRTRTS